MASALTVALILRTLLARTVDPWNWFGCTREWEFNQLLQGYVLQGRMGEEILVQRFSARSARSGFSRSSSQLIEDDPKFKHSLIGSWITSPIGV